MSMRALKAANLAQLQKSVGNGGCGYTKGQCGIGPPDGQPPPASGPFFVSIVDGSISQEQDCSFQESYSIRVVVSDRMSVPWDRVGPNEIDAALNGVNERCRIIVGCLVNGAYTVMNAANDLINAQTGGPYDGFVEPLFFQGSEPAELVSGDWFDAEQQKKAGVRKTLRFGTARRIQKLGNVA